MKTIVSILLLVHIVSSQLLKFNWPAARITNSIFDNNEEGEYHYEVRSNDGQDRGETRTVLNKGTDQEKVIVEGYYQYLGLDGVLYTVGYTADENGFHPEGEHLPPSAGVKRRRPQVGRPPPATPPPPEISKKAQQTILGAG